MNKTRWRIEFMESCLDEGKNRMETAHALAEADDDVSLNYAKMLVYTYFSGSEYKTKRRKKRKDAGIPRKSNPKTKRRKQQEKPKDPEPDDDSVVEVDADEDDFLF